VFCGQAPRVFYILLSHPPHTNYDYWVELDFGFALSLENVHVRRVMIIEVNYEFEAIPSQHCWHA
jgi:hypothetical protein